MRQAPRATIAPPLAYNESPISQRACRVISAAKKGASPKVTEIPGKFAVRFGLKFSTSRPTDSVESWLERLCHARFEIRLDGVDVAKGRKELLLVFEDAEDRDRVKQALKARTA